MVYSVKGKNLHAHTCKKYPRTYPSTMTKSAEFLIFTVVFLHPFFFSLSLSPSSYLFPFFLFPLNLFSYYILWFLHQFFHPRVGQALGVIFLCSPLPLLEPSTLSYKAACSLFRHHLHINAARELAGQYLMRRLRYFLIFVFPHPYPLSDIFLFHLLQSPSETLP